MDNKNKNYNMTQEDTNLPLKDLCAISPYGVKVNTRCDRMTDSLNMKIQYKSQPLGIKSVNRYLLYRINPSELSWWKRTFKNPWRYAFTSYKYVSRFDEPNDCLCFLFSPKEANEFVSKNDTYEKIMDFLTAELNKAKNRWYKAQEKYRNENNSWKI